MIRNTWPFPYSHESSNPSGSPSTTRETKAAANRHATQIDNIATPAQPQARHQDRREPRLERHMAGDPSDDPEHDADGK